MRDTNQHCIPDLKIWSKINERLQSLTFTYFYDFIYLFLWNCNSIEKLEKAFNYSLFENLLNKRSYLFNWLYYRIQ